jgi:serine/threonine protein phosphatase PrpC
VLLKTPGCLAYIVDSVCSITYLITIDVYDIKHRQSPVNLSRALREAFLEVDSIMRGLFDPRTNERSGCTAVAVMITPTHIITANSGDSRALLSRGGVNVELSYDHKPWLEVESTRIEKAGGAVSFKRVDGELAVSRALGDFQYKDPDLPPEDCKVTANPDVDVQLRTEADQFIVIACDGIWDVMTNEVPCILLRMKVFSFNFWSAF